jgi:hypothetical protein
MCTMTSTLSSGVSQPLRTSALWNCYGDGYSQRAPPATRGMLDVSRSVGNGTVWCAAGACASSGMLFAGFGAQLAPAPAWSTGAFCRRVGRGGCRCGSGSVVDGTACRDGGFGVVDGALGSGGGGGGC